MGNAAGRVGLLLGYTEGRVESSALEIGHPEYDVAGALLDHGTRQVQMVYLVIGSPAAFEVIVTQRVDGEVSEAQTEELRTLVHSIRRDVGVRCSDV